MKKLSLLSVLFFGAVSVWAAGSNIKMVSYFPVPYVSYSDLKVSNTCDVGLGNSCTLNATSLVVQSTTTATANAALNTGTVLVKEGNLELFSPNTADSALSGTALNVGNGSNAGNARLSVGGNLTVDGTFLHENTVTNLTSTNLATIQSLQLQGGTEGASYLTFPTCDATDNKISWANLTIDGKNGVYLVCGEGIDATPCVRREGTPILLSDSDPKEDTCNGDSSFKYLCLKENKKCWDVYRDNNYVEPEKQSSGIPLLDTCDGDTKAEYTGLKTDCVDVYFKWEEDIPPYTTGTSARPTYVACMTWANIEYEISYLKMYGAYEFCSKYVSPPASGGSCEVNLHNPGSLDIAEQGKYYYVTCEGYYYKKEISSGNFYGREMQCCENWDLIPILP